MYNISKMVKYNFVKYKYLIINKYRQSLKVIIGFTKKYTFLLLSLIFIILFFYSDITIENYSFSNILITLASIAGTILALVFTLSLIPIQNAASMWSFSVLKIYKKDRVSYRTFLLFGLAISFFILLSIFEDCINDNFLILILFLLMGILLDSLKFYYKHVVSLMDPQSILEKIKIQAFKTIDNIDDTAKIVAKNQYFLQEEKTDILKLEAQGYSTNPLYPQSIRYWFNDLAEIYQKSLNRNDLIVAKATLYTMVEILKYFLLKRKNNITYHSIFTGLLPVKEADVSKEIINPMCEILKDLFLISSKSSTENMALEVMETYKSIAISLSEVDIKLTKIPISYAKECNKYAQSIGSVEIPFQSTQIIFEAHNKIRVENIYDEVDSYIIDFLEDAIIYLYTKDKSELVEYSLKYLMQLNRYDDDFKIRFEKILEVGERLVPFALIIEITKGKLSGYIPHNEVYSLTGFASIGNIYEYVAKQKDISLLIDILDALWRHLRNIAEKYDMQNSFMMHEINSAIEHISDINIYLIKEKNIDEKKLLDKFKWLLSFYWVAYDKKETFNEYYLRKNVETLKKITIDYMKIDYMDVSLDALSNINAIYKFISKKSQDEYLLRDIQSEVEEIRNFSMSDEQYKTVTQKCNEILENAKGNE